jgi:hypothetical protein
MPAKPPPFAFHITHAKNGKPPHVAEPKNKNGWRTRCQPFHFSD